MRTPNNCCEGIHSMSRVISTFILMMLFLSGCGSLDTDLRRFKGSINDSVTGGTFQRVDGPNTLLEIYQFSSPPFFAPTAWCGRSLFIEAPADAFQAGDTITIPNARFKTFYYTDYHHIGRISKELSGTIKIITVADDYTLASIDLSVTGTDTRFKLKGRFRNAKIAQHNRIER